MSTSRTVGRFLRSRRLAIALIVVTSLSAAAGTLPGMADWYTGPLFLVPLVWLTLSTAACAWERTAGAVRLARDPGVVTESLAERLKKRPEFAFTSDSLTPETIGDALKAEGFRVRTGPSLVAAWAGRVGLLGSPLFHWSLVGLFVAVVLGQATASTGLVGVPVGRSVVEEAASYGRLETGPLFPGHSGLTIGMPEWRHSLVIDGVERGPVPTVTVSRGTEELVSQPVYANRPLRHGSMLVHMNDWGLAAFVSIESSNAAASLTEHPILVDFADDDRTATRPTSMDYVDQRGQAWSVSVRLVPSGESGSSADTSASADAIVRVGRPGAAPVVTRRITVGERLDLPDGNRLALLGVAPYARLSIVRDWSIVPIYALLVTATVGLAIAMLVPYRALWVLVTESDGERVVHVVSRHIRRERLFAENAIESLGLSGKE